jgi:hypothetical protein
MTFVIDCACGHRLRVTEGDAGATVPCACGRAIAVPSLRELRDFPVEAEAVPYESAARRALRIALLAAAVTVFAGVALLLSAAATAYGGLYGLGDFLALVGQIWLLVQIARVCDRVALILALIVPFFTWYYAFQRWDIARWPFASPFGAKPDFSATNSAMSCPSRPVPVADAPSPAPPPAMNTRSGTKG